MSPPLLAVTIALGWLAIFLLFVGLCCAAADGDLIADRLLNASFDDETPDRLFVTLDPTAGPPAERRRA